MASIEDLLTPEERAQDLENTMAEAIDDALVASKIEKPRQTHIQGGPAGFTGFLMVLKDKPRLKIKFEMFPNETEEPHFKVTYQNVTCRFKITDCTPMKAEAKQGMPRQIKKIHKAIKTVWQKNREDIIKMWLASRPSDQNHGHQHVR